MGGAVGGGAVEGDEVVGAYGPAAEGAGAQGYAVAAIVDVGFDGGEVLGLGGEAGGGDEEEVLAAVGEAIGVFALVAGEHYFGDGGGVGEVGVVVGLQGGEGVVGLGLGLFGAAGGGQGAERDHKEGEEAVFAHG